MFSSVTFKHLFWFFGHPEVYVIVLPAFGIVSASLKVFVCTEPKLFGNGVGFIFYWICRILCMSLSYVYCKNGRYYSNLFFMCNISNWSSNCCKNICLIIGFNRNKFQRLIICNCKNFCFLFCFLVFTGLILANAALDLSFHDTYFVIGHFHYVLSITAAY